MVDLSTFNAEFCADVFKYSEVKYDCVPPTTMASVEQCFDRCLPPASPSPASSVSTATADAASAKSSSSSAG